MQIQNQNPIHINTESTVTVMRLQIPRIQMQSLVNTDVTIGKKVWAIFHISIYHRGKSREEREETFRKFWENWTKGKEIGGGGEDSSGQVWKLSQIKSFRKREMRYRRYWHNRCPKRKKKNALKFFFLEFEIQPLKKMVLY